MFGAPFECSSTQKKPKHDVHDYATRPVLFLPVKQEISQQKVANYITS